MHAPTDSGVRIYGIHTKSLRSPIVTINWVKSTFQSQVYIIHAAAPGPITRRAKTRGKRGKKLKAQNDLIGPEGALKPTYVA